MSLNSKQFFCTLILVWCCISCVPKAHAIFLQDPEDAVKKISLQDLAEIYTRPAYATDQTTEKLRKKSLDENAISLKKQTGVDARDSLFKILKNHNGIKHITITIEREYNGVKTDKTDFEVVNISFEYNGSLVSIYCITTKKNIFKMQSASFINIHKVNISNSENKQSISGSDALPLIVNIYSTSQK